MAVQIGIGLFTGQVPPGSGRSFTRQYRETLDLVRLAETVGFDSVWVSEHHGAGDGYFPSLLTVLAAIAAATERITLGTGVMLTPFHHPLRLAEDAATVDLLSGGRLILGLGLAWREEEFRMFGIPFDERLRRTVETVDVLRAAWTGQRFSHHGRSFAFDRVQVTPAPERPGGGTIPIYLGGIREAAIRRAGRIGDGWLRSPRSARIDDVRTQVRWLDEAAREAGRRPSSVGVVQLQNAFVWEDGDPWDVVRAGAAHATDVYAGWDLGGDTPGTGFVLPPPDGDRLRSAIVAGSAHEVARALRPFVEAFGHRDGYHLVVRLHYPGLDADTSARAIQLFAERVIPALKGD